VEIQLSVERWPQIWLPTWYLAPDSSSIQS